MKKYRYLIEEAKRTLIEKAKKTLAAIYGEDVNLQQDENAKIIKGYKNLAEEGCLWAQYELA